MKDLVLALRRWKSWSFGEQLAEGADGVVMAGISSEGTQVVAKVFKRSEQARAQFAAEQHFLHSLRHPNVVPLLTVLSDENVQAIVMPRYWGDAVRACGAIGGFKGRAATCLAQGLLTALAYLHSKRVAHRDVKPDNLLLGPEWSPQEQPHCFVVALADFGRASEATTPLVGNGGTWLYAAPEVRAGKPYGVECDLWSAAMTIVAVCTDSEPDVDDWEDAAIRQKVSDEVRNFLLFVEETLTRVLQGLVVYLPSSRMRASDASDELRSGMPSNANLLKVLAKDAWAIDGNKFKLGARFLHHFVSELACLTREKSFEDYWDEKYFVVLEKVKHEGLAQTDWLKEGLLRQGALATVLALKDGAEVSEAKKVGLSVLNALQVNAMPTKKRHGQKRLRE